jgi:AcrR family transcriptional regulator
MSMSSPTQQRRRISRADAKEHTRELLLTAAREAFAEHGYQGVSLDRIAERAGFTKGAMYVHFASKQALFFEVLASGLHRQVQTIERFAIQAQVDREGCRRDFAAWLDRLEIDENLPLLGIELQIESRRDPTWRAAFEGVLAIYQSALALALRHIGDALGARPMLPEGALANTMIAISQGLALSRLAPGDGQAATLGEVVRILMGLQPGQKQPSHSASTASP